MTFHLARFALPLLLALPVAAQAATLEQMAGQMIVVGFQGDDAGDADVVALTEALGAGRLGGVMFLKLNVKSQAAVREMNEAFRAALSDPNYAVYFDALTTNLRVPNVRRAIAAGKHIYVEKPIATSTADALALAREATAAGVKNGVVQDKLWLPGLLKLKYLIDTGFFGRILSVRGDFGYSYYASGRTINELIREHWPHSIQVGLMTLAFSAVVGLTLGIISAMNPGKWPDYLGTGVSLFCMTVPSFVFAKLMQYVVAVKLGWLPTSGWEGWAEPKYWVMPVLANSLGPVLVLQRYTRSAISDVMRSNYVRTARAKGLSERRVALIHIFKNALTPVVTVAGPMTASLITGSIFIEGIFRIPGLGWYTNVALGRRDYPLILASTLLWTTLISITYFITDIIYALLDPRVAFVKER